MFSAWQDVLHRVATATQTAGRKAGSVQLIAVGKTYPATCIRDLYECGQRNFGENYVQEFVEKYDELEQPCPEIIWHFIGPVQSNKSRWVAERAGWVHTVDRLKIAERLSIQRPEPMPPLNVCLQVNVSGEASKSGVFPAAVVELACAVRELPRLTLRGLMAIPAPTQDNEELARQFALLCQLRDDLNRQGFALDTLSMGMSADLELAIAAGATQVRVGTALFGVRDYSNKGL